ncbi:MAG: GNAT family N-acetyltransferase [Anaerolineae bacterium]|nr:GNAT family N-acetyltransferase [Anaerolineae bacterium]
MVANWDEAWTEIEPVRVTDLFEVTRLVFANMTGVDREFTAMTRTWWARLLGHVSIPFYLLRSGLGYKVMRGGQIAAFAFVSLRPQSGYIYNVVVHHPFRRLGLGYALMGYLEHKIQRQGKGWAALQVDADNDPAQSLYLRLGYQPYHPSFWRWEGERWPRCPVHSEVQLANVWGRGRTLYQKYITLEQEVGDAWAAAIVRAEYPLPRPTQGQEYRCLWQGREIGYGWANGGERGTMLILLLHPDGWGHNGILPGVVQLMLDQAGARWGPIDLHLGSTGHFDAAAPLLIPLGFTPRPQRRILMLKQLR